jgi:hypothetical protein
VETFHRVFEEVSYVLLGLAQICLGAPLRRKCRT